MAGKLQSNQKTLKVTMPLKIGPEESSSCKSWTVLNVKAAKSLRVNIGERRIRTVHKKKQAEKVVMKTQKKQEDLN